MILAYIIFVLSYLFFTAQCFVKDVIRNKNKETSEEYMNKYFDAFPVVAMNVLGYSMPVFIVTRMIYTPSEYSLMSSMFNIFVSKYFSNILFYITHWYFHHNKELFKYHQVHHEYRAPSGIRAAYTHPIDFVFGNMIPLGITPILLGADYITFLGIIILGNYNTIILEHSGHSDAPNHHILHHKYSNCNYGAVWIDKLAKTYRD